MNRLDMSAMEGGPQSPLSSLSPESTSYVSDHYYHHHNHHQNNQSEVLVDEFLAKKNAEFLQALVPTLTYTLTLMLSGLAGNGLVLVVYHRRFKPSVTRTYILAMSVVDLLTNVLTLPADMAEVGLHNTFRHRWLCKGFRTAKSFLGFLAAGVLVAVALDRHHTLCRRRPRPREVRGVYPILAVCAVLALLVTLPYSVLTGRHSVRYPHTNLTGWRCSIEDAHVGSSFLFAYNVVTGLFFLVCMILMAVSYVRIARQLWRHRKYNASVTGRAAGVERGGGTHILQTHTYVDEETCGDGSQPSTEVKVRVADADQECDSADTGSQPPWDTQISVDSSADFVLNDRPHRSCDSHDSCPSEPPSRTWNTCLPRSKTSVRGEAKDKSNPQATRGPDPDPTKHASSEDVPMENGGKSSDPNQREQESSPSLSRGVLLSRIRRTASDARSFIGRSQKFLPGSRSRRGPGGSAVKKIPTRTTLMMFVLTVVFIVNYLPYLLLVSLRSRLGMEVLVERLGLNGYHIGLRSYFINSAVNPLVYSFCSARFRQECQRLFHCQGK